MILSLTQATSYKATMRRRRKGDRDFLTQGFTFDVDLCEEREASKTSQHATELPAHRIFATLPQAEPLSASRGASYELRTDAILAADFSLKSAFTTAPPVHASPSAP